MFGKIEKHIKKINDLKKAYTGEFELLLLDIFKEIFIKYPELKCFRWNQYSPSFNDGEPCTFKVSDIYFLTKDSKIDPTEEDFENDWSYILFNENIRNPLQKTLQTLEDILINNGDILNSLYGDGYQITAYADKIEIDDYYHD